MVSSTLCPAVHILSSQNVYGRAEGIADHYWPWAVFFYASSYLYKRVIFFYFVSQSFRSISLSVHRSLSYEKNGSNHSDLHVVAPLVIIDKGILKLWMI